MSQDVKVSDEIALLLESLDIRHAFGIYVRLSTVLVLGCIHPIFKSFSFTHFLEIFFWIKFSNKFF